MRQSLEHKRNDDQIKHLNVAFEIKKITENDADFFVFEGLASTFEMDQGKDIVMPGAFKKSLRARTPVLLWQHSSYEPIGMPVEIRETADGLYLKGKLPREDTFVSGRVIPQMKIGSIKSMSIGFYTKVSEYDNDTNIRKLMEIDLREVSLVTFPMNEGALISDFKAARDLPALLDALDLKSDARESLESSIRRVTSPGYTVDAIKAMTRRDLERGLRDAGFCSNDAAKMIAGQFEQRSESAGDDDDEQIKAALGEIAGMLDTFERDATIRSIFQKVNSHA